MFFSLRLLTCEAWCTLTDVPCSICMVQLPALLPVGWVRPLEALSSVQARLHGTLVYVNLAVWPFITCGVGTTFKKNILISFLEGLSISKLKIGIKFLNIFFFKVHFRIPKHINNNIQIYQKYL